ncbi:MAG: glycosyltransferase family 2 protein [Desulfotomaculales bacterium]
MERGKVSVVVTAFNAAAFLERAVASVLNQTVPVLEVVVVDDASADRTPAVAEKLVRRHPGVAYTRLERNRGVSAARNEGIIRARGEWVAFLDADDAWLPEKLARQLAALARKPQAAWAYCDGWHADESLRPTRHRLSDGLGCTSQGWIYPRLLAGEFVWPSTTIFRREVFEAVGLFDEVLRGCEDWDFFIRVARRYPCVYVPEPLVLHRTHPASLTAAHRPVVREHCWRALEKLLSATPDLDPATRRRLYFNFHRTWGYLRFTGGDRQGARADFHAALKFRPWSPTAWFGLFLCHLPAPAYNRLVRWPLKHVYYRFHGLVKRLRRPGTRSPRR